jgi:hypothetical protein
MVVDGNPIPRSRIRIENDKYKDHEKDGHEDEKDDEPNRTTDVPLVAATGPFQPDGSPE